MDFDVPTDLLNQAQIGFREAVGLSSFHQKLTNLPSLSTVEATLDPSPGCQFCQAKLLRGLHSLICIYCGEYQKNDLDLHPISFSSTHGYNWLLQSLNFNGSELVGSLAEGSGINGGQTPAEDELTLSELLDLKISWRGGSKRPENNFDNKTSELNSSSNLGTPNFDFFTESNRDVMSDVPEEQPVAKKADQNITFEDQESFTSDWNAEFQFADTKMDNENLESVDQNIKFEDQESFTSDWNAEFQFADTKMDNENLESVDPYVGFGDLSAHMDVVFGQKEHNKKPIDGSYPFQDDFFADMNSVVQAKDGLSGSVDPHVGADADLSAHRDAVFIQKENDKKPIDDSVPFQDDLFADMNSAVQAKDGLSGFVDPQVGADSDLFARMDAVFRPKENVKKSVDDLDLFQDDLFADTNSAVQAKGGLFGSLDRHVGADADFSAHMDAVFRQKENDKKPIHDLDPFKDDLFADMNSAVQAKDGLSGSVDLHVDANTDLSAHMDAVFRQKQNDKKPVDDSDPFKDDLFAGMSSVVQAKDGLSGDLDYISLKKVDGDWFSDGNWQKSSAKHMDTIKDDTLFDIKPQIDPVTFQSGNSDFIYKSDKDHPEVTDRFQDDDEFDEWNDFTSSTGYQDSLKANSNEKVGTNEKISELNLFPSTNDTQELDFGKLLHSDIFSGDKNPSGTKEVHDLFSDTSTASRIVNAEVGNSIEGLKNDEITPNARRPEIHIQVLMSQMHDLSFMLKNELSVPSKPGDLDPNHI